MKFLSISTGYIMQEYTILDDGEADAAYQKIRAALAEHRPYGNDKSNTVTVETASGSLSIKLDAIATVGLTSADGGADSLTARDAWRAAVQARIDKSKSDAPT